MKKKGRIGIIAECPRCLASMGFMGIEEAIKHLEHCAFCQNIDESLDSAKRDYYKKLDRFIPYKRHSRSDIFQKIHRLKKINLESLNDKEKR